MRADHACGIGETPVNSLRGSREHGTMLRGVIADRDDRIELAAFEFRNRFRAVRGNINSDLAHGFNGQRIYRRGMRARAVNLDCFLIQAAKKPFGHLAPRGIPSAENQNASYWVHGHRRSPSGAAGRRARSLFAGGLYGAYKRAHELAVDMRSDGIRINSGPLKKLARVVHLVHARWLDLDVFEARLGEFGTILILFDPPGTPSDP